MVGVYALVGTLLAASALAVGFATSHLWIGTLLILALGAFWLLGQRRGWGWVASLALVLFVGAAALGLLLGLGSGWMLFGVAGALCAWDLDHFAQRLKSVGRVEGGQELERRHLLRLVSVNSVGLLLAVVALGIKLKFGFGMTFCLGLLAILGLSQVVGFLRSESD